MDILANCRPQRVFYYFEQLSRIPHGSGNTAAISDYCAVFARAHGLFVQQDEHHNVLIRKPASPGRAGAPGIILQGHLDMVCEKTPDTTFDFTKDALQLVVQDDWISARGTTLGADNGIAVAMILALLEDDTLLHPALEAVFTTDEETGMFGAAALDMSQLQGRTLLNLDSEDEGIFTASCAGGVRVHATLPVCRQAAEGAALQLRLAGLQGGHSGTDIHLGRASATRLMARILNHLSSVAPLRLAALSGGGRDNVIASNAEATIVAEAAQIAPLTQAAAELTRDLQAEYAVTDPNLTLEVTPLCGDAPAALDLEDTRRCLAALLGAPQGVQAMHPQLPGLVQSSANLGILQLEAQQLTADFSLRSSSASQLTMLQQQLECLFGALGGTTTAHDAYPAWAYLADSPLRTHLCQIWQQMFGKAPKVEAIHAGLECGLFAGQLPGLDAVSLGPQMHDVHTPRERLSISSTERVYEFLRQVLSTWQ